jgi:hypothetical protein
MMYICNKELYKLINLIKTIKIDYYYETIHG